MSALNQQKIEARMLNGAAFTYRDLCAVAADFAFADAGGFDQTKANMQIDRTIQKLRKAGKIRMKRSKGTVIWNGKRQTTGTDLPQAADAEF